MPMTKSGYWMGGVLAFLTALIVLASGTTSDAQAREKTITIGTAGVTGVYYPAGGAICRLVNRGRKEHGIRCLVESTEGSIANLKAVLGGQLDIGVAQSDWQYHAYEGDEDFSGTDEGKNLRSIFSLHSEPFTVLVRKDSGIKTFDDLKGKRVNIGNTGSGMRATMEEVMKHKGWSRSTFREVSELKAVSQGRALCDGKLDAIIYTAGHPNGAIQEVTSTCDTRLVDVTGPAIDKLMKEHPFYSKAVIPAGMYAGNDKDVTTFGVRATFFTSVDVDDDLIYEVVKAVFDNFENFKTLHPVFSTLEERQMIMDGNTAPLHEGALRYYVEHGWLKAGDATPWAHPALESGDSVRVLEDAISH